MNCYACRIEIAVRPRNSQQAIPVHFIQATKLIDLDTSVHYMEIQFPQQQQQQQQQEQQYQGIAAAATIAGSNQGNSTSSGNKRNSSHLQQGNNEPIMEDDFEFTDLNMTEELEEWMNILGEAPEDPFTTMF
mmetsp:Transcript_29932/g.49676  ORF Transcript_29932/g.49676 Transcript_29932/m.49676 type:complete len:132 (+) Transcript_29932:276-671(+)